MKTFLKTLGFVMVLFAFACETHHKDDHDDGHQHTNEPQSESKHNHEGELPSFAQTFYKDGLELFVEFPALVLNEEAEFGAHFTNLSNYKPIPQAKVSVKLGDQSSAIVDVPLRAGIFLPSITPEKSGKFNLSISLEVKGRSILFDLGMVNVFSSDEQAFHFEFEEPKHGAVQFLKEQAWIGDFALEEMKPSPFNEVLPCSGELIPALGDEISIVAPSSGIIELEHCLLPGKTILKAEALARISGNMLEDNIQNKYLNAESDYHVAKANFERDEQLVKEKIISEREFQNSRLLYLKSKADFESIAKNYRSGGKTVVSPAEGVIAKVVVNQGDYVEAGQLVAKIHVDRNIMLRADLPKYYAPKIELIEDANFIPEYASASLNVKEVGGHIIKTHLVTDDNSAFIPIFFRLPAIHEIIPHSYAQIFLILETSENSISVPNTALIENVGVYWVFVQKAGETFSKQEVKLGPSNGDRTLILSGLKAGDIVVTKGAYRLQQASMSNEVPEHVH
jgi:membrane fusion protein, heavy metal efflux system